MTTSLDTIRYHSGIAGEEVADMVDILEQEVSTLREQVEKLTKERDALVNAIDNEMVVTHMGVFNLGDDPKVALNKICCYAQDLGKFFAEDACKEQLATLAEQNEKMRKVLLRLACLGNGDQYGNSIGNCIAQEALSLPDLASPVLNRIRAEEVRMASTFISLVRNYWASAGDNLGVQAAEYLISALDARAAELEKTNG